MSSDFYGGYNDFPGEHQRCWVHLLRDLHKLKEEHLGDEQVLEWAGEVRKLYDDAHSLLEEHELGPPTADEQTKQPYKRKQRERKYRRLVEGIARVGAQYADAKQYGQHGKKGNGNKQSQHPCHAMPCLVQEAAAPPGGVVPVRVSAWVILGQQPGRTLNPPRGGDAQGIGGYSIPKGQCHPHGACFPVRYLASQGSQPL